MSKIRVPGHFLGNRSLNISNFLHDGSGKWEASFECGSIFGKNLNLGGLREIKCQKFGFLDIFSETGY